MLIYQYEPLDIDGTAMMQILGVTGYNGLTIAMRAGDVSVIDPFRYTHLLFALALGIFVFDESPDLLILLGGLLIIASGTYTLMQSRTGFEVSAS